MDTENSEPMMKSQTEELRAFVCEFRDGIIGTNPKASKGMCALVSTPLRADLKVIAEIETKVISAEGHTFLVTGDGKYLIDPTIDQLKEESKEKVKIYAVTGTFEEDERLMALPFVELMECFKRMCEHEGRKPGAREAGAFVATYIYYPLAQKGFFEGRME